MKTQSPLEKLRQHVTGAIERGDAVAIVGVPAAPAETYQSAVGTYGIDWNNVNLADGYESSRNLIENLTFDGLLLEINCNLPVIDAATVTAQFEADLQSRITEAREIFAANLNNIVRHARKARAN